MSGKSLERNMVKNLQATMSKSKEKQAQRLKDKKVKILVKPEVQTKQSKPTDIALAQKYINKSNNAYISGFNFTLTFAQFKRLFNRKYCQLSGVELNFSDTNSAYYPTLDRIDNLLGYINGNVVCAALFVNQFKGVLENPNNSMTIELATLVLKNTNKFMKKIKD